MDEECLDLLQGYLALTDSVLDHIMNARTIDHIHSSEELKKVSAEHCIQLLIKLSLVCACYPWNFFPVKARNLILRIQNRKLYKLAVRETIIIPREVSHDINLTFI